MNDLVRFAQGVQTATGKKRGRHPVFNSRMFYPYKEELRLQVALKAEISRYIAEAYAVAVNGEAFSDDLETLANFGGDLPEDFRSEVSAIGRAIGRKVSESVARSSEMIVGKPYYPPNAKEEIYRTWEANFQTLCKSAESDAKKEISRIVSTAKNEGWNGMQLEKAIKGELEPKFRHRAELIARTESAKLNGSVTRATYREMGCRYYVWMATMDERTRPDHQAMNGVICSVDDPTVYYTENPDDPLHPVEHQRTSEMCHLHPGDDFQCRCTSVAWDPEIDGKYEIKERPEEPEEKEPSKLEQAQEETAKANERAEMAEARAKEAERRAEILQKANERHGKRGNADKERVINSKVWRDVRKSIKKNTNVEYNEVKKLKSSLSEKEIVDRLAGGDQTNGSCASLAFAYVANKAGYDVLDFRGGESCKLFATRKMRLDLFKNYLVRFSDFNGYSAAKAALSTLEDGKEYYFFTGRHAAIVRKRSGIVEYLELQSRIPENNGFKTFTISDRFLKKRFGCQKTMSTYGIKLEQQAYLANIETIANNYEFQKMMGFINTSPESQMKGIDGDVK